MMGAASGKDLIAKQGMKKLFGKPNQKKDGSFGKVSPKNSAMSPARAQ